LDPRVRRALRKDLTIDITTLGRRSGTPHRIEIWFHNLGEKLYITGSPGARDWYANLKANPRFTFHLKDSVKADLPALARPIEEEGERRRVLTRIVERLNEGHNLQEWLTGSPLVEVELLPE